MSDTLYSFSSEKETNTLSVLYKQTHRSNFFIPKVKHCFEAKINQGCNEPHIGFSPNSSIRSFVSLSNRGNEKVTTELISSQYFDNVFDVDFTTGDTIMACLDTQNKEFIVNANSKRAKYSYSKMPESRTWYAMIDTRSTCTSNSPVNVEVNLGKKEFVNTLPDGFLPFIRGYKTNNCFNTQCKTKHSYSHIFFIIFLQSHS